MFEFSEEEFDKEIAKFASNPDIDTLKEFLKLSLEAYSLKNISYAQNIEQRRHFASLIFTVVCLWLIFVLIIVIACGKGDLKLSDTVLSILLGTVSSPFSVRLKSRFFC